MQVVAQASNHKEIEAGGRIYRAKNGIFDLPDHLAEKAIQNEVGQRRALSGIYSGRGGWKCECGFEAYFSPCSRCGRVKPDA